MNMKKKIGRPKSTNPKNNDVKIRFDDIQHNKLMKHCVDYKINRTDLIRKAVDFYLIHHDDIKDLKEK